MRAMLACLGLAACGPAAGPVDVSAYPASIQADYAVFVERCSRCHGLDRPLNARVAEGGWDTYVERMARHPGAGLTEDVQRQVARFLEFHHRQLHPVEADSGPPAAPNSAAPDSAAPDSAAPDSAAPDSAAPASAAAPALRQEAP